MKLVGNSAGFAMEMLGVSHWAVEDIAFTRVLPNMTVLSAADSLQAIKMVIAADEIDTPVYIRLSGGQNIPVVYEQDFEYQIGKAIKLKEGKDIAIIATGLMVHESLLAAELLEKRGIHCSVIDMHTIKPLDEEILDDVFSTFELIVTVEEHNVIGQCCCRVQRKSKKCTSPSVYRCERPIFEAWNSTIYMATIRTYSRADCQ